MYGRSRRITILLAVTFLSTFIVAYSVIAKIMSIERLISVPSTPPQQYTHQHQKFTSNRSCHQQWSSRTMTSPREY